MPRIRNSGNDSLDFCRRCFPSEAEAEDEYDDVERWGEGPDDRGDCFCYDDDHPDYEDSGYECQTCRKPLTDDDNGW